MKAPWWQAIVPVVLWIGVAVQLWALGAWLLLVFMSGAVAELLLDAVVRVALVIALVAGIAISRRSRNGYMVLAVTSVACVVMFAGALVNGSLTGTMALTVAAVTAPAAFARWFTGAAAEGEPTVETAGRAVATPRSPVEAAATMSLAIAGLLVLGRVLLTLVTLLAELPGADEHQAGDVVMALIFFLPIPILAGAVLLAAARWLWRRRAGARRAAAAWLVLVGICWVWIVAVVGFLAGQGNYIYPLDDPLLWAPIAGLVGSFAGAVLLVALEVQRRVARPAHQSQG